MNPWIGRLVALGAVAACMVSGPLAVRADEAPGEEEQPKKKKATEVRADKLGGISGVVFGEDRGHFYPFVLEVAPDSPAFFAGVRRGDELIRIQDQPARDLRSAEKIARAIRPGAPVKLFMRRAGINVAIEFTNPRPEDLARPKKTNDPEDEEEKTAKGDDEKPKKKKRRSVIVKPLPPNQ